MGEPIIQTRDLTINFGGHTAVDHVSLDILSLIHIQMCIRDRHYSYPLMGEVYKRRRYLTSYGKTQKTNFDGVVVDRNAEPDSYSGIVSISDGMITLGDNGEAVYELNVPAAGSYDLAVKLGFPCLLYTSRCV